MTLSSYDPVCPHSWLSSSDSGVASLCSVAAGEAADVESLCSVAAGEAAGALAAMLTVEKNGLSANGD
jgi:hypothetical protein